MTEARSQELKLDTMESHLLQTHNVVQCNIKAV